MGRNFTTKEVEEIRGVFNVPFFTNVVESPEFCADDEYIEKLQIHKMGSKKKVELTLINEDEVLIVIFDGDGSSFFDTKKIKFIPETNDLVDKLKTISEYF